MRRRAQDVAAKAEQRVQRAMEAQLVAERALRWIGPPFTMPGEAISRRNGDAA